MTKEPEMSCWAHPVYNNDCPSCVKAELERCGSYETARIEREKTETQAKTMAEVVDYL